MEHSTAQNFLFHKKKSDKNKNNTLQRTQFKVTSRRIKLQNFTQNRNQNKFVILVVLRSLDFHDLSLSF